MIESGIIWWLGQHLLITTALAAIVYLICRAGRPNPSARHILWLLVLCRLLVPPVATWPWSIAVATDDSRDTLNLQPTEANVIDTVRDSTPMLVESRYDSSRGLDETSQSMSGENMNRATTVTSKTTGQIKSSQRFQMAWLIAGFWGTGSLITVIVLFRRIRRVGELLRMKSDIDTWLQNEIADCCDRLKVRVPDCAINSEIRSPFLWCLGCVRLALPLSALQFEQREQLRPILIHELAHLKRRDHWTAWIELLALIVWWWNPVLWFVQRQLRISAEMACDAWVVEMLPDQRCTYAKSLVEFSSRGQIFQRAFGAVGANICSRRTFKRRLEMIMNENPAVRFSKWTVFAAILLVILSLPAFAIKSIDKPQDSVMQSRISVSSSQAIDEHDVQFNQPMNEQLFAENVAAFQSEEGLDPENHIAVSSDEHSVQSEQQEWQDSDSRQESSFDSLMESITDEDIKRNAASALAAKHAELATLTVKYSSNHPDVIRVLKEIKTLEEQLAKESSETTMIISREQGPVSVDGQSGLASQQERESLDSRLETSPIPKSFIIGVKDVLRIDVWKEPELCVGEAIVRPDGKISIPLIGDVQASGRTPVELKVQIEERLRDFISSPIVTVVVLQFRPQYVSIVGKIEYPGVYYLDSSITVLELLARAGGCSEFADVKNIAIVRKSENRSQHFKFNYKDVVMGNNLENNLTLQNGDVVIVP
jgi:polysaccharide export outer membrane protein